jgi:hypothetical protein
VFSDDFESYGVGTFPSSGGWELVWNGMGDQYQVVTGDVSHSPTRSFQLLGDNETEYSANVQRKFSSSSSLIGYEASVMCEGNVSSNENVASICIWNLEAYIWGKRFAGVYFQSDGYIYTIPLIPNAWVFYKLMPYAPNTWYKVRVVIDRSAGEYSVWIDDALIAQNIAVQDTNQIEALMLAAGFAGFKVHFDDVRVFETRARSLTLYGSFDYGVAEQAKVKIFAQLRDKITMEPISAANVSINVFDPNGTLWVSADMVEFMSGTGIYEWDSPDTVANMHLQVGVYLAQVAASNGVSSVSDIVLFHIDPLADPAGSATIQLYLGTIVALVLSGISIGLVLFKRVPRSKDSLYRTG